MKTDRMRPTLLILAAGRGSRFGGPKQLAPVGPNGEPLLAYTIHDAVQSGFGRIALVCPESPGDAMAGAFRGWAPADIEIETVEQKIPVDRTKPWGTGHAILEAGALLEGRPFGVSNGDDFYGRGALETLGRSLAASERRRHVLVTYALAHTLVHTGHVSRGLCRVRDGELDGIEEVLDLHAATEDGGISIRGHAVDGSPIEATGDQPVSMNLWGFVPPFLDILRERWTAFRDSRPSPDEEFLLPRAVGDLVQAGRIAVEAVPTDETPFGLTRPEDLQTARAEIARRIALGHYPADLRSGSQ